MTKKTDKEILEALKDQMEKDIVRLENGEYDKNDFICDIEDYLRIINQK